MTTRDTAAEPRTAAGRLLLLKARRLTHSVTPADILAIEAEAASGPTLTTADIARALIESDLIPRYMEYARLSPSMNPAETIEHVAATWAPRILARLAPAAAEPAEAHAFSTDRDLLMEFVQWLVDHPTDDLLDDPDTTLDAIDRFLGTLAAHPAPEEQRDE